jgi:hypothetical protein
MLKGLIFFFDRITVDREKHRGSDSVNQIKKGYLLLFTVFEPLSSAILPVRMNSFTPY